MKLQMMAGSLALAFAMTASVAPPVEQLYRLDAATPLPSSDTDWDYIKLEPNGPRLFIARRKDGLTVYDVNSRQVVGQVANSQGANGPLLLPQFNRGYVAMTDGSLLIFDLKTLAVIERRKLADDGGLNTVTFDRSTGRVHAVVGVREASSTWYSLDAKTGKWVGKTVFPFRKMDEPAPDGKGHLYAPVRYDNLLLRLNSKTLAEEARWPIDCDQVVAVEYQHTTDRLLIACRGDKPVFLALDPATGRQLAKIPIGKGVDGMAVDEHRHRIVTSNGGSSTLTVIRQDGPDSYKLVGNVQTRPQARVLQIDEHSGRLFTVAADSTTAPPESAEAKLAESYHADSFVVLTYRPM